MITTIPIWRTANQGLRVFVGFWEYLQKLASDSEYYGVDSICVLRRSLISFPYVVTPGILRDPSLGTHEYISANGLKFHYVVKGEKTKPIMLMLHGFPEASVCVRLCGWMGWCMRVFVCL